MKKISLFALAFVLCLGLSACGGNTAGSSAASAASGSASASESASSESASTSSASASESASAASAEAADAGVTMQALVDANSPSAIKANCDSLILKEKNSGGTSFTVYDSKDFMYTQYFLSDGTVSELLDDGETVWTIRDVDGEKHLAFLFYAMSDEEVEALGGSSDTPMESGVLEPDTVTETITSVVDNGDGTLTVVSSIGPEEAALIEDSFENAGLGGLEGSEWSCEYVADKETLAVQRISEIAKKDGTEVFRSDMTVEYNADPPEGATKILGMLEKCLAADAGETRTVTVIYDAGTPQEEKFEKTATKSAAVTPVTRTGYDYLYGDPDKKTEVPEKAGADLTIYAFAEK